MGKIFHTKLNIKSSRIREALKRMAGTYRKIFNVGMDLQFHRMVFSGSPKDHLLSSTFLHHVMKVGEKELYPYISKVDSGISRKAINNANYSFKRWYTLRETRLPVYKARKDELSFATTSKIKVFYDHIKVPKLGDIKLYEKGYIPQGKVYKNARFSFDGKNWWITLEALEKDEVEKELQGTLKVAVNDNGDVTLGDKVFTNVVDSDNYKAQKKKRAKLMKKLNRQKKANASCANHGKKVIRTSRNMMKTRRRIQLVSSKMKEIKKDYFRKVASEVARTKPQELHLLSLSDVRVRHGNYLSRFFRESGTRELLDMIKRRAESIGSKVKRYSELTSTS